MDFQGARAGAAEERIVHDDEEYLTAVDCQRVASEKSSQERVSAIVGVKIRDEIRKNAAQTRELFSEMVLTMYLRSLLK